MYNFDLTVTDDQMHGKVYGRSEEHSWTLVVSMTREKSKPQERR